MIPKRIIYCWFGGGEPTDFMKSCIASWKEMCPDYEIIRVDEKNFDVKNNPYSKAAYEHKNYSFVSDVARLWALKKWNGIYLDTDIKLVKPLDELLKYKAFISMSGKGFYNSGCLGCDEFPEIFEEAYENLKDGRVVNELLNELVYQKYDVYGNTFEVQENFAFLGNEIFISPGYTATENTMGYHYAKGLWNYAWKGSFDKTKTFKGLQIYQDGVRDIDAEKKVFGERVEDTSLEVIGKLNTIDTPFTNSHIFYGNYFYNPKVMILRGNGFTIERFNKKETNKTVKVEDVILECI